MRILLVEDFADVRSVIAESLREEGHVVVEAYDLATASRALNGSTACEAAIVDVVLPGGTRGTQVAELAKRAGIPVLLYTGDPASMSLLQAQGVYHLRKPFHFGAITQWLSGVRGTYGG